MNFACHALGQSWVSALKRGVGRSKNRTDEFPRLRSRMEADHRWLMSNRDAATDLAPAKKRCFDAILVLIAFVCGFALSWKHLECFELPSSSARVPSTALNGHRVSNVISLSTRTYESFADIRLVRTAYE